MTVMVLVYNLYFVTSKIEKTTSKLRLDRDTGSREGNGYTQRGEDNREGAGKLNFSRVFKI